MSKFFFRNNFLYFHVFRQTPVSRFITTKIVIYIYVIYFKALICLKSILNFSPINSMYSLLKYFIHLQKMSYFFNSFFKFSLFCKIYLALNILSSYKSFNLRLFFFMITSLLQRTLRMYYRALWRLFTFFLYVR